MQNTKKAKGQNNASMLSLSLCLFHHVKQYVHFEVLPKSPSSQSRATSPWHIAKLLAESRRLWARTGAAAPGAPATTSTTTTSISTTAATANNTNIKTSD